MARSAHPLQKLRKPAARRPPPVAVTRPKAAARSNTAAVRPDRRQARRKRQMARTRRRFEAIFTRLPKPALRRVALPALRLPGVTVLLGLALVVGLASAVVYLQTAPIWFVYRETVQIDGATYLNEDEIYAASGVDSWNIFWLRPQLIRQRLRALRFVEDAAVSIGLPNRVRITIAEEQPVALWVTSAGIFWLMANGAALPSQDQRFDLLPQIVDPNQEAQSRQHPEQPGVDPAVVSGALALWAHIPNLEQLRFNRDYGLNFKLPDTLTWVYWGDGERSETKFAQLAAVQKLMVDGAASPQVIDVRFERAYFH